jgi:signal transduction histidine kinase
MTGRLGIVGKLMIVSVVLLTIPLLTLRYLHEMHDFVLKGQQSALQLAAQAVATVLHGREDLFAESGGLPFSPFEDQSCSPLPLAAPVRIDGNGRDWVRDPEHTCHYQRDQRALSAWDNTGDSIAFDLTLAQRDQQLYALFEVYDDSVRFRHPRHRNLDGSDHIRITIPGADGKDRRYVVTAGEPGPISAYEVGESWRYALGDGLPVRNMQGVVAQTQDGYTLEMRVPLEMLPQKKIGFAVADVDGEAGELESVVGVFPGVFAKGASSQIHLVLLESPEIDRILRALELPGARISVIDKRRRVRSVLGTVPDAQTDPHRWRLIDAALEGGAGASESGKRTTAASSPIRVGDRVVGAVLIEQANDQILALPRLALLRERNAMIIACVVIAGVFWLFASRLAWRIHRLSEEAGHAIDPDGRVKSTALDADCRAGDELGDLSRAVSGLLARLARYTTFLERVPATLRHELSNPLNSVSMSLQNLVCERPDVGESNYLKSAERGVARIGEIVESLTEAASLEEALRHDELELIDLAAVVRGYVENFAAGCPQRRFALHGADEVIEVLASGFRIEQLLDKLVDNAVASSPNSSEIALSLSQAEGGVLLRVGNQGAPIREEVRERMFESMFSGREGGSGGGIHMGLGLYVVRGIVESLGGRVGVEEQGEPGGVVFWVELPVAELGGAVPQWGPRSPSVSMTTGMTSGNSPARWV